MAFEEKKRTPRGRKAVPKEYLRKRPVKKIALFAGIGVLLCATVALLIVGTLHSRQNSPTEPTAPPPDTVIHFVAGGDVNITDKTVNAGLSDGGYDYKKVFQDVIPVLSQGDITALNFEGIVNGAPYGAESKSAPTELLNALRRGGVDLLQTANSYSVFDGMRGLEATLRGIRAADITPLGTYENKEAFEKSGGYIIWEIQGIKVAMMAFTKGMNEGMGLPSENSVNLLYEDYNSTYQKINKEGIAQVVRNAAAHEPDIMIAMVHWGSEGVAQISKTQQQICTLLQEEGVDAIIGTHSHLVQKMEHDPESGKFVAYSLGDFYGDGQGDTQYSVLLDLEITQSGATGQTKVTGFDYVPIFTETKEDGSMRVLRIHEAIAGYENRYLDRVSEETYTAMKTALTKMEKRIGITK